MSVSSESDEAVLKRKKNTILSVRPSSFSVSMSVLKFIRLYTHLFVYFGVLFNTYANGARIVSNLDSTTTTSDDGSKNVAASAAATAKSNLNKEFEPLFSSSSDNHRDNLLLNNQIGKH